MCWGKKTPPPSASDAGTNPAGCARVPCTAAKKCDAAVTIGRVLRGNPYVPKNASAANAMPDSVPPSKTYEVEVTVTPSLENCPGQYIELSITGGSADNGSATVAPAQITKTTTVIITGGAQTRPGNAGQLKIQAKLDGVAVKAESAGFTVCAHPINYSDTFDHDISGGGVVGVAVQDGWDADSGTFADLDETEVMELVNEPPPTVPPYHQVVFGHSHFNPGDALTIDSHTIRTPSRGPAADWIMPQLEIYKCHRCGCTDIDQPNSGRNVVHHVFNDNGVWKHRTDKVGAVVTIGAHTAQPGALNVRGTDHVL